jgi:hypothetical protein
MSRLPLHKLNEPKLRFGLVDLSDFHPAKLSDFGPPLTMLREPAWRAEQGWDARPMWRMRGRRTRRGSHLHGDALHVHLNAAVEKNLTWNEQEGGSRASAG